MKFVKTYRYQILNKFVAGSRIILGGRTDSHDDINTQFS
jgi:hypothetical protein